MKMHGARFVVALLIVALVFGMGQFALAEADLSSTIPQGPAWTNKAPATKVALKSIKMTKATGKATLKPTRDAQTNMSKYIKPVPAKAALPELTWSTSNAQIAPIDPQTGIVTFKGHGKVRLTATTPQGKKASMVITIKAVRVTSVKISGSVIINVGETHQLTTKVAPAKASYPEVTFTSSNPSAATVDEKGLVTAHGGGTAVITATADRKSAKATIRVRPRTGGTEIKLSAIGDVTLGGDATRGTLKEFKKYYDLYKKETGNPYTGMFVNAIKYFANDDLTIANLEGTLTKSNSRTSGKYRFKGDPAYANILSKSGIDVVNLANNHTRGYANKGFSDTKAALNKAGVKWNGFAYKESKVITVKGKKVGIIGFQTGPYTANSTTIKNDVKKLRAKCDALIVSLHFGDTKEYTNAVTKKMQTYARTAVKYGADVVLGHHPHVISGMERYMDKNIVYGLGTFLASGTNPKAARRTMIFQETLVVHEGFADVKDPKVIPFWITSSTTANDRRPTPATDSEADAIINTINKNSVGEKVNYQVVR